ncbi:type IV pilus assembly protein FimV [Simplicispira lacusdiani]|uniref:type IV pilus assembly protein FimV n=1 Tax=Simplicispira lacusdiani TaxID=2213010 RepID=UPI001300354F|nr:hypothetical protein [Simplicispira lacusdiani]
MNFRNALITICLGSAACGAGALSLGNARGVVVLGRPIDLAFDVHLEPGKALEDACVTADMVSGTTPVSSGRVRVTPLPTLPGRPAAVRVQSTFLADEPMLAVTLHVGCSGKIARTYTFLSELPDTIAASSRPVAIPVAEAVTGAMAAPSAPVAPASAPGVRRPAQAVPVVPSDAAPAPRQRTARASQAPEAAPAATPRTRPAATSKASRRANAARAPESPPSRLVIEPLEGWPDTSGTPLRMTPELSLPSASTTDQQRAQAQAAWRALNMLPEDLLKEGARTAELNTELALVRAQADKDRAATQQLLERLEKEKSERYSGTIVYLLLALLVTVVAWAAWMATRLRAVSLQAQEAWAGAVAQQASPGPEPEDHWLHSAPQDSTPDFLHTPAVVPSAMEPAPEPSAPREAPAPVAPLVKAEPVPPPRQAAPQPSLLINPEELFDLQQQAEFFVSVGEHEQAIGVLKLYIANNKATAPAAYLELLRLYRSLSRVEDFNQLRAQFHEHFNAQVPQFAAFNQPGRSLLAYPSILAQVEALWSDDSVLPLLGSLLFRGADAVEERFDLAAYDDLLLLNAIARTTPPSARGAPPPRQRTTPLVVEEDAPAAPPPVGPSAGAAVDLLSSSGLPDGGDSLLDYDPDWLLELPKGPAPAPRPAAAPQPPPTVPPAAGLGVPLDFDLSAPFADDPVPLPPITQSDLPPMPVTKGPEPGQAVGFGANSDRFEARHDPDERKPS